MVSPGPCRQFLLRLLLAGPPCLFWCPLHVPPHKPLWTHTLAAPRSHAQQSHTSTQVSTALAQVHPFRPHCREAPLLEHSPWDSSSPTTRSMQLLPPLPRHLSLSGLSSPPKGLPLPLPRLVMPAWHQGKHQSLCLLTFPPKPPLTSTTASAHPGSMSSLPGGSSSLRPPCTTPTRSL